MTFGDAWAEMFEASLSRQMAGIVHLNVGNPKFRMTEKLALASSDWKEGSDLQGWLNRMNSGSTHAFELIWRFDQLIHLSDSIFIEARMLDTAIGQYLLQNAYSSHVPVWGVATDSSSSPLAAMFLKGIVFPATPDDLVKLILGAK